MPLHKTKEYDTAPKMIIGSTTYVQIFDQPNIPAKIDTGADTSAIWASNIAVNSEGKLTFQLFDKSSDLFTGKTIECPLGNYEIAMVRSAHGDQQIRYRTTIPTVIKDQKIDVVYTLADRSQQKYPILIGRRTLQDKFLVDVSLSEAKIIKYSKIKSLKREHHENPYEFFKKYIKNKQKGATK